MDPQQNETKQPEAEPEVKQPEASQDAAALAEPAEETVGDIMQKNADAGLRWVVIVGSILVYVAAIAYAEVHGLNMLTRGVSPDFLIWAYVGMVALGVTALLLPLALKVWTIEAKHRIAAFMFYAVDLALLGVNAFTDYGANTGAQLASWAQLYLDYIMPATPVIAGIGWSLLWMLDPDVKDKVNRLTLRAAMKEKMSRRVAEAAKGASVSARVNSAAEREVERALTELFGAPVRPIAGYVMDGDKRPGWGELLAGFFGLLSKRGQSEILQDTRTQSEPSDSHEQSH